MTKGQWRAATLSLTTDLNAAKNRAARLGLWRTMHALDAATRVTGYEQADIITGEQINRGIYDIRPRRASRTTRRTA